MPIAVLCSGLFLSHWSFSLGYSVFSKWKYKPFKGKDLCWFPLGLYLLPSIASILEMLDWWITEITPLRSSHNSLHVIVKGKCESILTNFPFYFEINCSGVYINSQQRISHPASMAKEVRIVPINNRAAASPSWPELTLVREPSLKSKFFFGFCW